VDRRDFLAAAAGAPLALRSGRVVDLATGRVERYLETLPGPRSIESVIGTTAVVAHTTRGAVTLVDGPSLRIRHVLHDFVEPRYTAAHPAGRFAYVTDSTRGEIAAVDVVRGRVVHRTNVGLWARHVTIDPAGRRLWVALGTEARLVAIVDLRDPARPRLLGRLRPPFLAHDVGFSPNGRHVWVTSGDRGRIAVYDAGTQRLLFTVGADAPPQHVAFSRGLAYVTSGNDGTLRVHALADGRLLRTTPVPEGSYNVQEGWGRILTPSLDLGTLCVLDGGGRLIDRVRVAPSSHDACFVMSV